MGETFFDYVNRWRIKAAMPSITSGKETMLEIALAAGFNSRSTFYKAFKRLTGSTPRKYRELGALAPPIES
jgi:AraC-like DNA-binding protein